MSSQESSRQLITGNIIINLIGNVIPMIVALISIPIIINHLGNEQFGILSIAWLFLGYFSILDLGIGRSTTKLVLDFYHQEKNSQIKSLVWTSVILLFGFGIIIGITLSFFSSYFVEHLLNIPLILRETTIITIHLISITIPFITGVAALKGVLEAQQRFKLLNIIKIPSSILNYVIPVLVFLVTNNFRFVIFLLATTRVILFFIHYYFCFTSFKSLGGKKKFRINYVVQLMKYGGWLTMSNLIGPLMIYFDRFIIGSILTLTLLTYYSTPFELVTKLLVIAGSATTVLFPIFARFHNIDKEKFSRYYNNSIKGMLFILFPITFFVSFFSYDILNIWVGEDFALQSTQIMQLLTLGVFLNSLSSIPFTALQAINRPDLTAKIHLCELPMYLVVLWLLAINFGVVGVAVAWMLRNLIDTILFFTIQNFWKKQAIDINLILVFSFTIISFMFSFFNDYTTLYRLIAFVFLLMFFMLIFWFSTLTKEDRFEINNFIRKQI